MSNYSLSDVSTVPLAVNFGNFNTGQSGSLNEQVIETDLGLGALIEDVSDPKNIRLTVTRH